MRDPHVVKLYYKASAGEGVSYDSPPELAVETKEFRLRLSGDSLEAEMLEHHAYPETARVAVEAFLKSWEIHQALEFGKPELVFEYNRPEIVDRNPPKVGEPQVIRSQTVHMGLKTGMTAIVHVTRAAYPEAPKDFRVDPVVEILWLRYQAYDSGNEKLLGMAYFVLTTLEEQFGGGSSGGRKRKRTARRLNVSYDVLHKIGEISSTRGDSSEARKSSPSSEYSPLTDREVRWVTAAVKLLTRRVGQIAAGEGPGLRKLTMDDLPAI